MIDEIRCDDDCTHTHTHTQHGMEWNMEVSRQEEIRSVIAAASQLLLCSSTLIYSSSALRTHDMTHTLTNTHTHTHTHTSHDVWVHIESARSHRYTEYGCSFMIASWLM